MRRIKSKGPNGTGRGSDQFMVRFPEGMRTALAERAEAMGRSMNAEVVDAIRKHLGHASETERLRALIRDVLGEETEASA